MLGNKGKLNEFFYFHLLKAQSVYCAIINSQNQITTPRTSFQICFSRLSSTHTHTHKTFCNEKSNTIGCAWERERFRLSHILSIIDESPEKETISLEDFETKKKKKSPTVSQTETDRYGFRSGAMKKVISL